MFRSSKNVNTYVISVILGLSKGIKAVYQSIIIPKYVSLEKLPAATGLCMVLNGILSLAIGPIIGKIRITQQKFIKRCFFNYVQDQFTMSANHMLTRFTLRQQCPSLVSSCGPRSAFGREDGNGTLHQMILPQHSAYNTNMLTEIVIFLSNEVFVVTSYQACFISDYPVLGKVHS